MGRGCVKTPRSFQTLVVLVCFRGLRSIRSRKIAKIFGCAIVRIFSTTFYTASVELTHSAPPGNDRYLRTADNPRIAAARPKCAEGRFDISVPRHKLTYLRDAGRWISDWRQRQVA